MSNDEQSPAVDPREQMRLALERKKQGQHRSADGAAGTPGKGAVQAGGPAGAKKQFIRRKAGG